MKGMLIMAIEQLSGEIKKIMDKEIQLKANSTACSIKVDGDVVNVTVPSGTGFHKVLVFPKREIRELLEKLYTE
jgi:hypothetical protein